MRARAIAPVLLVALAVAAAGCGKSDAEKQADCQKAINSKSTTTHRPDACKGLSQDDYETLLMDWTLKHTGLIDKDGNVNSDKLLDSDQ